MDKKKRTQIKIDTSVAVLFGADHCCCMCRNRNTRPTIHHIDGNPDNNKESNLVPLCPNHHDEVHTKTALTRNFSRKELQQYKREWEQTVKDMRAVFRNPPLAQIIRFDGGDTNTIFLAIEENLLRPFVDPLTFRLMGFHWGNVDIYPEEDFSNFKIDEPLQNIRDCELIQLRLKNGKRAVEVFVVWEGRRHHVPNPLTLAIIQGVDMDKIDWRRVKSVPLDEFNAIPKGNPALSAFNFLAPDIKDGKLTMNLNL